MYIKELTFNGINYKNVPAIAGCLVELGVSERDIPELMEKAQYDFDLTQAIEQRKRAYRTNSDPLFIEWQYDQTSGSEQIWRDKVAAIKAQFPLPNR